MVKQSVYKLLAWDTSSKTGTLVAMEWQGPIPPSGIEGTFPTLVTELSLNVDLTHSERLLWGIHQVLESARWKLDEVDYFGVGVGPGSFTGLRIGVTTARTLAHTLKKPLIGVSSLSALARPVILQFSGGAIQKERTFIIAATDACKGELFVQWGWADHKGGLTETVLAGDELIRFISDQLKREQNGTFQWVVVGEARTRFSSLWEGLPVAWRNTSLPNWHDQIQGRYVGLLAFEVLQAGGPIPDALKVLPQYYRASEAERKLKAGLLASAPVTKK